MMTTMTMTTTNDLAQRVAERLTNLKADQERWLSRVRSTAATAGPETCDVHRDAPRLLDEQESCRLSLKAGEPLLAWHPCELCRLEQERHAAIDRQRRRGVPESCVGMTFERWRTDWSASGTERREAAKAKAIQWADDHKTGSAKRSTFLFLLGKEPGTGKTSLAVATATAIDQNYRVQDFSALVELARKGEADDRIYILQRCKVLVLDEFGSRQIGGRDQAGGNALELDTMSTLLHYRYERAMPTIITGNLSADEIRGRLDGRTLDRVNSSKRTIDFNGLPSKRTA
jgi:DNA replication protein DnaC